MSYKLTQEVIETGNISIKGDVTPSHWYSELVFENGRSNFVAVILLSNIFYWYRPTEVKDESTGRTLYIKNKFKADFLQRHTKDFADQFGFSSKQVKDALRYLESKGLIRRHFRTVRHGNTVSSNVQFIQLIPSAIIDLQKIPTSGPAGPDPRTHTSLPPDLEVPTYTDSTTKTSSNIKNNNNVVEKASPVVVFSSLNKLNISKELKISLSKHHDEQKVNLLVKRVLKWKDRTGDAIACNTILNSWDTWCDKDTLKDREEQNKAESNELLNKLKKRRERAVNVSCEYPELNLVVTEHNICIQSAKGYVTVGFNDKIFDGYLSKIERQAKNQ